MCSDTEYQQSSSAGAQALVKHDRAGFTQSPSVGQACAIQYDERFRPQIAPLDSQATDDAAVRRAPQQR